MKTLELYFNDLTPAAQEKYLKFQGVSDASELNWEVNPITILEVEDEPDTAILNERKMDVPLERNPHEHH